MRTREEIELANEGAAHSQQRSLQLEILLDIRDQLILQTEMLTWLQAREAHR